MDTELSFPKSVKDSFLQASGYFSDGDNQDSVTGQGYVKRKELFGVSKTVQLIAKIDADLFNSELYLINNVQIDLQITPNDQAFMIMQPTVAAGETLPEYVLEITSLRLFVKTIDLIDGLALDISRKLEKTPAKYAIRRSMLKHLFISENRTDFNQVYFGL